MKSIDKLTKRITDHIDAMPALGLGGWRLHVSIVDEVVDNGVASCSPSRHYDTMWLEFEKGWLKHATDEDINQVIRHELLHAVMRDFDNVVESLEATLGEPAKSQFREAYKHELEGVVERIARTLDPPLKDVVQSS